MFERLIPGQYPAYHMLCPEADPLPICQRCQGKLDQSALMSLFIERNNNRGTALQTGY